MSMNLFEKGFIAASLGATFAFMGAMYFKGSSGDKKDAFKVRQELIQRDDVKILYSTISFFYLQAFKPKSIDSLFTLQKILQIQNPTIVALPMARQEFDAKYKKAMNHPKYRQAMDKFTFHMKNRNKEEIQNIKDFDLKNLEKLYLIDFCLKKKKCEIIYGRRTKEEYQKILEAGEKLKAQQNVEATSISSLKIDDYTESIIDKMTNKNSFMFFPQTPFKIIIGIIQPDLFFETAKKWKQKFKQNYKHQVIEDEEVLEREEINRAAQGKS